MIDKEKIRKEVERLRNLHQMKYQQLDADSSMSLVECGKRNLCNELLSFIDSLQEEPVSDKLGDINNALNQDRAMWNKEEPVSDNLDDAAFDYAEACKYDGVEKLLCVEHFKAGAKWQLNQIRKKNE